MIIVLGSFRMPVDSFATAQPMMEKVIDATRAEDGCILYAYSRDIMDTGLVRVAEKWRDRAALDAHFQTEHMKVWAHERASLGLTERDIMVFESDEGVAI